jgi:hypothetical protein
VVVEEAIFQEVEVVVVLLHKENKENQMINEKSQIENVFKSQKQLED